MFKIFLDNLFFKSVLDESPRCPGLLFVGFAKGGVLNLALFEVVAFRPPRQKLSTAMRASKIGRLSAVLRKSDGKSYTGKDSVTPPQKIMVDLYMGRFQ